MSGRVRWVVVLLLLGGAVQVQAEAKGNAGPDGGLSPDSGFEVERVSWIGEAAEGQTVTVHNRFGDLRARFGGYEGQVEVFGNVQQFADEGPRLIVETATSDRAIVVTVGYRDESGSLIETPAPEHKKRADLVVYVPKDVPLHAITADGLLDVRGLKSAVRASTSSGDITARKVDGTLHFESESGDVSVRLETWEQARHHSFSSARGDLSIYLAGDVTAQVDVSTRGLISTDYSMKIEFEAGAPPNRAPVKHGVAVVGKRASTVTIESLIGHIRLVRRPVASEALVRPGRDGKR